MKFADFKSSLKQDNFPDSIPPLLCALWQDAKGKWIEAHHLAQEVDTADGAWVHAYLHRKEGDAPNAQYWYNRAGKKSPNNSLEEEWEEIVKAILNR